VVPPGTLREQLSQKTIGGVNIADNLILTYWSVLAASVSSLLLLHSFSEPFVSLHDLTLGSDARVLADEYFAGSNVALDRACVNTFMTCLLNRPASS
jgi:hypothetical protein